MILVTGGTGLVGSHLLLELLRRGERPRAIYRDKASLPKIRDRLRDCYPDAETLWSRIDWVCTSLSDIPGLEQALKGVRVVYHCAGLISFDPGDEEALLRVNRNGTANLVNVALAAGVREICHASSIATIGGIGSLSNESDIWDPNRTNPYATSKYLGEMEVWRGGQEGIDISIVNPGVILGPGDWERGSGRLFGAVSRGLGYSVPGGTGFVGVWDVVRCMIGLIEMKHFDQRFILVSENLSYREVLGKIAHELGTRPPARTLSDWQLQILWRLDWLRSMITGGARKLSKDLARSLGRQKKFDNSRIQETLGFSFEPVGAVIERCAAYFRNTGANQAGRPEQ